MKTKLHIRDTYSSNRALESVIWVIAIALIFILVSYTSAYVNPTKFKEASNNDDIQFDPEMVVNERLATYFDFEDEGYICDIPFNTDSIVASNKYIKAVLVIYDLKDETYIDDITFGTEIIVKRYKFNTALSVEFKLNDELFIDDISFDTISIDTYNNKVNKIIP